MKFKLLRDFLVKNVRVRVYVMLSHDYIFNEYEVNTLKIESPSGFRYDDEFFYETTSYKNCSLCMYDDRGLDNAEFIYDQLVEQGVIVKHDHNLF